MVGEVARVVDSNADAREAPDGVSDIVPRQEGFASLAVEIETGKELRADHNTRKPDKGDQLVG